MQQGVKFFLFNFSGQVFYFFSSILFLKFISLENYGISATLVSLINLCAHISTGKYDLLILYDKDNKTKEYTVLLSFYCSIIFPLFFALFLVLLKKWLFCEIGDQLSMGSLWLILWLSIFCNTNFNSIVKRIYIRNGQMQKLSYALFSSFCLRGSIPYLFLFFFKDWRNIVFGETLGYLLIIFFFNNYNIYNYRSFPLKPVVKYAIKQKMYPLFQLPSFVLNEITFSSFFPSITFLFGSTLTGQFAFIYRLLTIPMSMLGGVLGSFYEKDICKTKDRKELISIFLHYRKILVFFSCVLFLSLGIAICGLSHFYTLFQSCLHFLITILIMCFSQFIVSSLSAVLFMDKNGLKYDIAYEIVSLFLFCFNFVLTYVGNLSCDYYINGMCLSVFCAYIFYYFLIYHYVRNFRYTNN